MRSALSLSLARHLPSFFGLFRIPVNRYGLSSAPGTQARILLRARNFIARFLGSQYTSAARRLEATTTTGYPLFNFKSPALFCHLRFQFLLRQEILKQRLPLFLFSLFLSFEANSCAFIRSPSLCIQECDYMGEDFGGFEL